LCDVGQGRASDTSGRGGRAETRRRERNHRLLRGRTYAVVVRIAAVGRMPSPCAGNRPGGGQGEADGGDVGPVAVHRDCLDVNDEVAGVPQLECERSGGIGSCRKGRTVAERDAGCRKGNVRTSRSCKGWSCYWRVRIRGGVVGEVV